MTFRTSVAEKCCSMNGRMAIFVFLSAAFYVFHSTYGYMGATMGVPQHSCDDGKTNLIVDWDYSFTAYTCMGSSAKWRSNPDITPIYYSIPNFNARKDQVFHYCMNTSILYKDRPPIRGHHRPLWAKYGEYLYVPPQRWLHNLEHGSIIMLYHPCADEEQVNKLRQLVTSCLFRYVITPYDKLSTDRPLALVAWGAKLEMNTVDIIQSVLFMRKHAHVAPEDISKEGQFEEMLLKPASVVTDADDAILCPWVPSTNMGNLWSKPSVTAADKLKTLADSYQLSRNMLFGQTGPQPSLPLKGRRTFSSNFRTIRDPPFSVPDSDFAAEEERKPMNRHRRTFVDVVNVAEKYNGPNFVADVLPPTAMIQMFEQPSYVVAGSFLGNSPMHPNTIGQASVSTPNGAGPPGGAPTAQLLPPQPPPPSPVMGNRMLANGNVPFQNVNDMGPQSPPSSSNVLAAMAFLMRKDAPFSNDMMSNNMNFQPSPQQSRNANVPDPTFSLRGNDMMDARFFNDGSNAPMPDGFKYASNQQQNYMQQQPPQQQQFFQPPNNGAYPNAFNGGNGDFPQMQNLQNQQMPSHQMQQQMMQQQQQQQQQNFAPMNKNNGNNFNNNGWQSSQGGNSYMNSPVLPNLMPAGLFGDQQQMQQNQQPQQFFNDANNGQNGPNFQGFVSNFMNGNNNNNQQQQSQAAGRPLAGPNQRFHSDFAGDSDGKLQMLLSALRNSGASNGGGFSNLSNGPFLLVSRKSTLSERG